MRPRRLGPSWQVAGPGWGSGSKARRRRLQGGKGWSPCVLPSEGSRVCPHTRVCGEDSRGPRVLLSPPFFSLHPPAPPLVGSLSSGAGCLVLSSGLTGQAPMCGLDPPEQKRLCEVDGAPGPPPGTGGSPPSPLALAGPRSGLCGACPPSEKGRGGSLPAGCGEEVRPEVSAKPLGLTAS